MLLGDWLTLLGVALLVIGLSGWMLPQTGQGPRGSDYADRVHWRRPGLTDALLGLRLRWRPETGRPAAPSTAAAGLRVEAHDLTDYVCRLADGSMGRVAIIAGNDEEWTAVCVSA